MCSGREVTHAGITYTAGGLIDAPDDVAHQWIAAGVAQATVRAKPVVAPRPLTPNLDSRAQGKR